MNTEQFIKDAIAGEYNGTSLVKEGCWTGISTWKHTLDTLDDQMHFMAMLLDPLAWQAVGKRRGWTESEVFMDDYTNDHPFMGGTIDYPYQEGASMAYKAATWRYNMHRFIDHLSDGLSIEDALSEL